MASGCDICLPQRKGYTVYFEGGQTTELLTPYFETYLEEDWIELDASTFWAEESIVFDLLDYLVTHFDGSQIFITESKKSKPFVAIHDKKPIETLHILKEASWIDRLIETQSIQTHYQPIVRINQNQVDIIGYELLSRGIDQEGNLIPPFKMFEAARTRNRLFALDRACRMVSVRNAARIKDKMVFINFIPTAIYVPEHCLSTTFALINQMDLKPEQVVFEVVETDEVQDINHLKKILNYYKTHGVKYALDDVGTGHNGLKKLSDLKPHFVKLAREFADGVSEDPSKQQVAKSVIKVAKEIHSQTLAEGVERKEDIDYLTSIGYELFQGYFFAKPQENPITETELNQNVSI
ncbi:EAL domain-containing protein [Virgibacillus flavescens]|uniref:EAL domain-containing protein n=1 Tax=Virgibacillus flavescens TaxID=1611422 RepID=UPI003D34CAC7